MNGPSQNDQCYLRLVPGRRRRPQPPRSDDSRHAVPGATDDQQAEKKSIRTSGSTTTTTTGPSPGGRVVPSAATTTVVNGKSSRTRQAISTDSAGRGVCSRLYALPGRTTRLSKRVVLAAASATGAAAETKVVVVTNVSRETSANKIHVVFDDARGAAATATTTHPVNAVPVSVADGMAPALTEPTAVPTAPATTKTDSSSPQPEIFQVCESGGFSPPPSEQNDISTTVMGETGDAENALTANMGQSDQLPQLSASKASKRTKKEELPLKELRSTRRRSNLNPTTVPAVVQTNGKATVASITPLNKPRWSGEGGSNGGTVRSGSTRSRSSMVVSKSDPVEVVESVNMKEEESHGEEKEQVKKEDDEKTKIDVVNENASSGSLVESEEKGTEGEQQLVVVNNNNYLDKNRVPIASINNNQQICAVKGNEEEVEKEIVSAGTTIKPVIKENEEKATVDLVVKEEEVDQQQQQESHEKSFQEVEWARPSEKESPVVINNNNNCMINNVAVSNDLNCSSTAEQLKALASDAALLEQLVLTTPTKKLTEQLCMVLKDQERALEQQEQQQQQQQQAQQQQQVQQHQSTSNPSSQTMLKESAEMDQMLGDLAATSELDLLQVFKSFDCAPVADDLSLLVADDDVDMMAATTGSVAVDHVPPVKGGIVNVASTSSSVIVESEMDLEAKEQELDMMERKKMLNEMEQELSQMQRRRDFLLRRLRKQQLHQMGRHLSEEVVGLFELSARGATTTTGPGLGSYNKMKFLKNNTAVRDTPDAAATASSTALKGAEDTPTATEQHDVEEMTPASIVMRTESPPLRDVKGKMQTAVGHHPFIKPPSPKTIRSFVQKIVAGQQSAATAVMAAGKGTSPGFKVVSGKISSPLLNKGRPTLLPFAGNASMLDDGHRLQLTNNIGLLTTELRVVERAMDSEATASSSGGESADELINYSNSVQESLAIANRAAWRWAQERARLASRWNWLTAEISDLEYRIRQHTDLHNQLRKSKGPLLFLRSPVKKDKDGVFQQQQPDQATTTPATSVNGYRGLLPGQYSSAKAFDSGTGNNNGAGLDGFMADVENEVEGTASRTRPYQRTAFKKRKLVQTMNLHTISKKAARPSSIKCGCQWPQQPCALCTGRSDPMVPRPLPDMVPRSQRAGLLDAGFHPCLSFPDDIPESIRFEAVMANPQWQHKVLKSSKMALKSSIVAAAAAAGCTYKSLKMSKKDEAAKKAGKKYTQGLINRYKKSKNKSRGTHTKYVHLLKQQKSRKVALKAGLAVPLSSSHTGGIHYGIGGLDATDYESTGVARSRNASPTHNYYRHDRIERRSRISYDIDNIVIPYSVAASTRVEILPYKEIPTPKWKLVDETDLDDDIQIETSHYQHQQQQAASSDSNSSTITALEFDSEEFLEEYIEEKHSRALLEERKKFSTFLKFPYSTRSRANRRIDSRAESDTPDPASPAPNTPSIGGDHESIPSPMCPSTPAPESVLESETSSQGPLSCTLPGSNRISSKERRRTISLKLLSHQNSTASDAGRPRSQTPEPTGPPFEPLLYPLSDRKYDDMLRQMPLNHERLDEICTKQQQRSGENTAGHSGESVVSSSDGVSGRKVARMSKNWSPVVNLGGSILVMEEDDVKGSSPDIVLVEDSDTESYDSVLPEEDPNDPEWTKS